MLDNGGDCEPFKSSTTEVSKTRTREGLHAGAMKRSSSCSEATLPGGTQPGNKLQSKQNESGGWGDGSQDWYPVGKRCIKVKGQMRRNKDVKKRFDYVSWPKFFWALRIMGKDNFVTLGRVSAENNASFSLFLFFSISPQLVHFITSVFLPSHSPISCFPIIALPPSPVPPPPFISLYLSIIDSDQCWYFIQSKMDRTNMKISSERVS